MQFGSIKIGSMYPMIHYEVSVLTHPLKLEVLFCFRELQSLGRSLFCLSCYQQKCTCKNMQSGTADLSTEFLFDLL